MKIQIRQIQSLRLHGATSHLLIFNNVTHILLDCGISSNFDFSLYKAHQEALSKVEIILLTHSSLEYLGALPFIIEQFNIKPKIYATQPIIILGPLNIHEACLNLYSQKYNSELFKRIYLIFESITPVKPLQKKYFNVNISLNKEKKRIYFSQSNNISMTCYQVGSTIGSICWKLSYCMFSCLYLVGYNNYLQFHLEGMDLDPIINKKTDLIITDCYTQKQKPNTIRRENFKQQIETIIANFMKNPGNTKKIIFSCYPNQRVVELMYIIHQLNKEQFGQNKVDVVHVSTSYLQLIKSQSEYLLLKINDDIDSDMEEQKNNGTNNTIFDKDFSPSRKLNSKICITTSACVKQNGLLWSQLLKLNEQSLLVHVGNDDFPNMNVNCFEGINKIFYSSIQKPSVAKIQEEEQMKEDSISEQNINIQIKQSEKKLICGKYIHNLNFPRFISRNYQIQYDTYGERFQYTTDIINYDQEEKQILAKKLPDLKKKKISHVENMHIQFQFSNKIVLANNNSYSLKVQTQNIQSETHKTTFDSSIQILKLINPEKIVFINCTQVEFNKYRKILSESRNKNIMINEEDEIQDYDSKKIIEIHGIHKKGYVYLQKQNETLQQTLNLIKNNTSLPEQLNFKNILKVNGKIIKKTNNEIVVELVRSEDKELMEFHMNQFYKKIRNEENCIFTENGIEVNGIKLSKRQNQITIQGVYSVEYFRLRELLYRFIESVQD